MVVIVKGALLGRVVSKHAGREVRWLLKNARQKSLVKCLWITTNRGEEAVEADDGSESKVECGRGDVWLSGSEVRRPEARAGSVRAGGTAVAGGWV